MTLKENDLVNTFYYSLPNNGSQEGLNSTTRRYAEAKQCALIADEFAKEVLRTYISNKALQYKQSQGDYSLDELLNIIKKEKGL